MAEANCTRACKHCKKEFRPARASNVYCCKDCRVDYTRIAQREKYRQGRSPSRVDCEKCGREFVQPRLGVKFCSWQCRGGVNPDKPRLADRRRNCIDCATAFTPGNPNQRLCDGCRFIKGEKIECAGCGETFTAKHKLPSSRKQRYCTSACGNKHAPRVAAFSRLVEKHEGKKSRLRWVYCKCCGDLRGHHRKNRGATCGKPECGREWRAADSFCRHRGIPTSVRVYRRAKAARKCCECGVGYTPGQASMLSRCPPCLDKRSNRIYRMKRRVVRRVDDIHPKIASIDPIEILKRDKWRCYICGTNTPKRKRGTHDDNAPQVDHITPLTRGGKHRRANLACACFKCNLEKSNHVLWSLTQHKAVESRADIIPGDKYILKIEKPDPGGWPEGVRHLDTYTHLQEIGW